MTVTINRERVQEEFRSAVLAALDTASRATFNPSRNDAGASDADLPRLFKAIDAQIEALADRYGFVLVDYQTPTEADLEQRRAAMHYLATGEIRKP